MKHDVTLRLLVSWPWMEERYDECIDAFTRYDNTEVLIDSGAYTFDRLGVQGKTVEQYAAFLRGLEIEPVDYFMLDVRGDAEATLRNYREMLDMGLRPVPIWTRGAPVEHFYEMADTADYVGVGGLSMEKSHEKTDEYLRWLQHEVMRPGDAVHWLGIAKVDLINYYLPRQCDTTGWQLGYRWGHWRSYYGGGRWSSVMAGGKKHNLAERFRFADYLSLRRAGYYDVDAVFGDHTLQSEACAAQFLGYATDLAQRGTKMFFASTNPGTFLGLIKAYERGRDVGLYA